MVPIDGVGHRMGGMLSVFACHSFMESIHQRVLAIPSGLLSLLRVYGAVSVQLNTRSVKRQTRACEHETPGRMSEGVGRIGDLHHLSRDQSTAGDERVVGL